MDAHRVQPYFDISPHNLARAIRLRFAAP